eukprot:692321-Rhodomonas_salina.1
MMSAKDIGHRIMPGTDVARHIVAATSVVHRITPTHPRTSPANWSSRLISLSYEVRPYTATPIPPNTRRDSGIGSHPKLSGSEWMLLDCTLIPASSLVEPDRRNVTTQHRTRL